MTIEQNKLKKPYKGNPYPMILVGGAILLLAVIIHSSILYSLISNLGYFKESKEISVDDFINPNDTYGVPMPRWYPSNLTCGPINTARYAYLNNQTFPNEPPIQFYFALDLDEALHVVHTLFLALSKAMIHLGPQRCYLSIVGNPSKTETWAYLEKLVNYTERIGVQSVLKGSALDSRQSHSTRIEKLAQLRNEALYPLYNLTERNMANSSTIIIFSNDISLCPNDVLELVHQHLYQKADSVCALDWNEDAIFYDTWISRTLTGHLFLDVEKDLWWKEGKIFFNDPISKNAMERKKPFQVFSCWNGILTLSSEPFLKSNVRFRGPVKDECSGGEPFHLSIDFWNHGYYKIAVAPAVNVAYDDKTAKRAKLKYGTSENLKLNLNPIAWNPNPPAKLSCPSIFEGWKLQYVPWNEGVSTQRMIFREIDSRFQKIQEGLLSPALTWIQRILLAILVVILLNNKKQIEEYLRSCWSYITTKFLNENGEHEKEKAS